VESLYSSIIITFIFERPKQYDVGYDKGKERSEYCRRLLSAIHTTPQACQKTKKTKKEKIPGHKTPSFPPPSSRFFPFESFCAFASPTKTRHLTKKTKKKRKKR
jgi:hypothetical protein